MKPPIFSMVKRDKTVVAPVDLAQPDTYKYVCVGLFGAQDILNHYPGVNFFYFLSSPAQELPGRKAAEKGRNKKISILSKKRTYLPLPGSQTSQPDGCASAPATDRAS